MEDTAHTKSRREKQQFAHVHSKPWEWMTNYTQQTEWIEGSGKFIWLALFLTELGAGIYFMSVLFTNPVGMLVGWIVCMVLGCLAFLMHTGHPLRLYRAPSRFASSWISRGFTFVSLLGILGLINMIVVFAGAHSIILSVILCIISLVVMIYAGMVLSFNNGIPMWNTGLVPFSFVIAALWGGAEVVLALHILQGLPVAGVEHWIRFLLPCFSLIIILYLYNIWISSDTGKASVARLLKGDLSIYFYVFVVLIGLIIPLLILAYSYTYAPGTHPSSLYVLALVCGLIGDLSVRYCIMKSAYYNPILKTAI
ncbi:MAG: polysulfide reductase NrfD [Desulfohalobiaceae bacterium]|nr:polysulfide reductase NrfD [Desulfohalobiaceae bacterium]